MNKLINNTMIYLIETTYYNKNTKEILDLLKIGYTKYLNKRLDTYLLHNPECVLLDTREGDSELESFLHSYFSKYKYPKREEWFYYNEEIINSFKTLQIGDKFLTKNEYIIGLKEYLINNIPTVSELKNKYLKTIIQELEELHKKKENICYPFDINFYKRLTREIWENEYNKEILYIKNYDFQELLKYLPETINLKENPWHNCATLFYRTTADYRKMKEEDFKKILERKQKETENLLKAYTDSKDNSVKYSLANAYQTLAKTQNYKNDYVGVDVVVNDTTGDKILVPHVNELVYVNELRAFKIQQIDYADRLTLFSTVHDTIETYDSGINQDAKRILEQYESLTDIQDKYKLLCESPYPEEVIKIVVNQLHDSDPVKGNYSSLGPQKLKALNYRKGNIQKALGIVTFNPLLLQNHIYQDFKVGDKLSLAEIKQRLVSIYNSINYDKAAKANDLESYFETRLIYITVIDGKTGKKKQTKGYELLSQKYILTETKID